MASSEIDAFGTVNEALKEFPSETDVPEPIEKFIDGLVNSQLTSTRIESVHDKISPSPSTPADPRMYYQAYIKQLEKEIEQLEVKLEEEDYRLLEFSRNDLDEIEGSLGVGTRSRPDAVTDNEELLNKMQLQEKFTGVEITDIVCRIIDQSHKRISRVESLMGRCSGFHFNLTYHVQQQQVSDGKEGSEFPNKMYQAMVSSLEVEITDRQLRDELQGFIQEVQRNCALQPFLRGFQQYTTIYHERRTYFEHLQKKYPDAVMNTSTEGPSILQFHHPVQKGVLYTILWGIEIDGRAVVTPQIDLRIDAREEMLKLDKKKVLETAPEEFKNMIDVLGHRKAIETLIKAVAT